LTSSLVFTTVHFDGPLRTAGLLTPQPKERGEMSRKVMTALSAVVLLLAQTASADVLWDRSNYDAFGPGFFNVDAGSPPFGLTVHTVNHVSVGGAGWTVQSITTYYSALDPAWGTGIVNGYLHVYDKTGPLPIDGSDDPTASPLVAMSATFNGDHWAVTASGLSLPVGPGEHWIGITPGSAGLVPLQPRPRGIHPDRGSDRGSGFGRGQELRQREGAVPLAPLPYESRSPAPNRRPGALLGGSRERRGS
jgi:hypothetical protein